MRQRRDKTPDNNSQSVAVCGAVMQGEGGTVAGAFVVRAGKTRHKGRPRQHWREAEYAQAAMQTIHRGVPPRDVDRTKLWRDVNTWLANDSGFLATGLGEISRKTVERELLKLQRQP
jgi:hypothetical protein